MIFSSLAAGVLLVVSLFIGFFSLNGAPFLMAWSFHIIFQCAATLSAILYFFSLVRSASGWRIILYLLFLLFLSIIIVTSLVPITARDSLIYHLAVPQSWIEMGRIAEVSWNEWAYFPLLMSIGYTGFLKISFEAATPFYNFTFLLLMSALAAKIVHKKTADSLFAAITYLLLLSMPLFLRLACAPTVDLGAAYYFVLFFSLFLYIAKNPLNITVQYLAGIALGLSISIKYNTLLAALIFVPIAAVWLKKENRKNCDICMIALRIASACALIFSFWPIKNYIWTGNPFYPFLDSFFPTGETSGSDFLGGMSPLIYRQRVYGENFLDFILLPLRIIFTGQDNVPPQFDGVLSPVIIFSLLPLFLSNMRKENSIRYSYIFVALFFGFAVLLFHIMTRYYSPAIWILSVLLCLGLWELARLAKFRNIIFIILGAHFSYSAFYGYQLASKAEAIPYLRGTISREEYLDKRIGEYPAIRFINNNIPKSATVYLLFTGNKYYYYRSSVKGGYLSGDLIRNWVNVSGSADEITEKFRSEGISYLLYHVMRTENVFSSSFSNEELRRWNEFLTEHTQSIFVARGFRLLKLDKRINS